MNEQAHDQEASLSSADPALVSYARTTKSRFWFIASVSLAVAALAVGYTYLVAPLYSIRATLLLPTSADAAVTSPLALVRGGPTPTEIIAGIISSRRSIEAVAKAGKMTTLDANAYLRVTTDSERNQVILQVEDTNREKGVAVLLSVITTLRDLQRELGFSAADRQASYLEGEVGKREAEVNKLQSDVLAYQSQMANPANPGDLGGATEVLRSNKNISLELSTVLVQLEDARRRAKEASGIAPVFPSTLPGSASWRSKIESIDFDLHMARTQYGPEHPVVVKLERDLEATKKLAEASLSRAASSIVQGQDPDVAQLLARKTLLEWRLDYYARLAEAAPKEVLALARLNQQLSTATATLVELRTRYERAKVEAAVDKVQWTVLEEPAADPKPLNKSYVRSALVAMLVVFLVLSYIVHLRERGRSADRRTQ